MSIPIDLLTAYGATFKKVKKRQIVFYEGDPAIYYYQIVSGKIKMSNGVTEDNQIIQGIFEKDQSFGEPPLFLNDKYPASAIAIENSQLIRLTKDEFLILLNDNSYLQMIFIQKFAKRLKYKSLTTKFLICNNTEIRILNLLKLSIEPVMINNQLQKIELTRQDVADLCGLRIETIIRALKKMEIANLLEIKDGKVFLK
jgi:CRP/FNR family cyclic AMP-dependent transcriptional regulator